MQINIFSKSWFIISYDRWRLGTLCKFNHRDISAYLAIDSHEWRCWSLWFNKPCCGLVPVPNCWCLLYKNCLYDQMMASEICFNRFFSLKLLNLSCTVNSRQLCMNIVLCLVSHKIAQTTLLSCLIFVGFTHHSSQIWTRWYHYNYLKLLIIIMALIFQISVL